MAASDIYGTISTRATPQHEKAATKQVKNSAGGYTFGVTTAQRVKRFLVLGSSDGSYYASARELTKSNADAVFELARTNHRELVDMIRDVSTRGAAPKVQPTLFALAIACSTGSDEDRRYALDSLTQVARTGTHLFTFASYVEQFRGWGRGLKRAIANWYTSKDPDSLAYQAVKYRQRDGWSHRDLLRLSHPSATDNASHDALFEWITKGNRGIGTPELVNGFIKANEPGADVPALIRKHRLSWEMLPDDSLAQADTWRALVDNGMPITALIRQLPRLTRLGLLHDLDISGFTDSVVAQLTDTAKLKAGRVHPLNVLMALRTYTSGRSFRGDSTWVPVIKVADALNDAFYAAFDAVEPAGKRTLLALDVSGSMSIGQIAGTSLTPREASAALALVQLATEPACHVVGFSHTMVPLPLSARDRLDSTVAKVSGLPFGRTDCALPMLYALEHGLEVDTFVIYTDSETWLGRTHPHQALRQYREKTGIDAKLIVVGMVANEFTVADPDDPGMLDVVGFDTSTPNLIAEFSRGF